MSAARLTSYGLPVSSSSPVNTRITWRSARRPASCNARRASMAIALPDFMSDDPLPYARAAFAAERLALQNRVEVADDQEARPFRAAVLGHEVARAAHLRLIHPPRLEAHRVQLGGVELADAPHTVVVLRGARDVDRARKQVDGGLAALVDGGQDLVLERRQLSG